MDYVHSKKRTEDCWINLSPAHIHVKIIQKPVHVKLAYGRKTKTDIAIIESEGDPVECVLLTRGFKVGFSSLLSLKQKFLKYNAVLTATVTNKATTQFT